MSYRFMRILVFFDLPVQTVLDRRNYTRFRKFLIKEGFIMLQESVYAKLALNNSIIQSIKDKIEKNKPCRGLIQSLVITEKQFSSIDYVIGEKDIAQLDSTERLVIL